MRYCLTVARAASTRPIERRCSGRGSPSPTSIRTLAPTSSASRQDHTGRAPHAARAGDRRPHRPSTRTWRDNCARGDRQCAHGGADAALNPPSQNRSGDGPVVDAKDALGLRLRLPALARSRADHGACRVEVLIDRSEAVRFVGPPGTAKSHLDVALGVEAVKAGRRRHFVTARRRQVAYARERGLPIRRTCTLFSVARSALSYRSRKSRTRRRSRG
jgi:IstB-like ATP binding protein